MKDSDTLIEKMAQRRARLEAVGDSGGKSGGDSASAPLVEPAPLAPATAAKESSSPAEKSARLRLVPESAPGDVPQTAVPPRRSGLVRWLLVIGVALLGFWLFSWVVSQHPAASPAPVVPPPSKDLPKQPAGQTVGPKPVLAAVVVQVVDSSTAEKVSLTTPAQPAAAPVAPRVRQGTSSVPSSAASSRAAAPSQRSAAGKSAWRESVTPLPPFNEANDGSVERSAASTVALATPTPSATPSARLPQAEPAALPSACRGKHGLSLAQCQRCEGSSLFSRPFCQEQTRLEFCQGRYGQAAECPLLGYAKGF